MTRQIIISFEDPWYIVRDISSGVVSQGESLSSAKQNLREALELYFEDVPDEIAESGEFFLGTLEVSA